MNWNNQMYYDELEKLKELLQTIPTSRLEWNRDMKLWNIRSDNLDPKRGVDTVLGEGDTIDEAIYTFYQSYPRPGMRLESAIDQIENILEGDLKPDDLEKIKLLIQWAKKSD